LPRTGGVDHTEVRRFRRILPDALEIVHLQEHRNRMNNFLLAALLIAVVAFGGCAEAEAVDPAAAGAAEDLYADSDGVRIHYVAEGSGPLVVFIHGFPDFWYSWRHQMEGLKGEYRVAAMDLRGYNLSDKPDRQEEYDATRLVNDVAAVIRAEGRQSATVVGHDWGGFVAWQFAFRRPEMLERLILVNFPHPKGLTRELAHNPEQAANSEYARNFQQPDSHLRISAEGLSRAASQGDETIRQKYVEAFERSSLEAMMFYYRQNYPREPYQEIPQTPVVSVPVLQFHGLDDTFLLHHGLNGTWQWLGSDYTLVTIPGVGHWAHLEAADLVTSTMKSWLGARRGPD
jgi:epoxide hydrolase 4